MNMNKEEKIKLLQEKITLLEDLSPQTDNMDSIESDCNSIIISVETIIESFFGVKEKNNFRMNTNAGFNIIANDVEAKKYKLKHHKNFIKDTISVLKAYIEKIEIEYSENETQSSSKKKKLTEERTLGSKIPWRIFISLLTTVLGGTFIIRSSCNSYQQGNETEQTATQSNTENSNIYQPQGDVNIFNYKNRDSVSNRGYRIVEVNFMSRIEEYDYKKKTELKKLYYDIQQRGMSTSGLSIKEIVRFFREWRRPRDNIIDSFLVAYDELGGDTLNLKYDRHLPIKVDQELKNRIRLFGIEAGSLSRYRLDTL